MNPLLLAVVLMLLLASVAYRLASWVKTSSSQKVKDRLLIGLATVFVAGVFYCFSVRVAASLSAAVTICVAADLFIRKGGSFVGKK